MHHNPPHQYARAADCEPLPPVTQGMREERRKAALAYVCKHPEMPLGVCSSGNVELLSSLAFVTPIGWRVHFHADNPELGESHLVTVESPCIEDLIDQMREHLVRSRYATIAQLHRELEALGEPLSEPLSKISFSFGGLINDDDKLEERIAASAQSFIEEMADPDERAGTGELTPLEKSAHDAGELVPVRINVHTYNVAPGPLTYEVICDLARKVHGSYVTWTDRETGSSGVLVAGESLTPREGLSVHCFYTAGA